MVNRIDLLEFRVDRVDLLEFRDSLARRPVGATAATELRVLVVRDWADDLLAQDDLLVELQEELPNPGETATPAIL